MFQIIRSNVVIVCLYDFNALVFVAVSMPFAVRWELKFVAQNSLLCRV